MYTVTVNTSKKVCKNTFPSDMIFTKDDAYISEEQVQKYNREFSIQYRACTVSLIYLLSTRVALSFAVHELARFSSNPGKVHFEGLVHLLRYIRYNKTLVLKYYDDMKDKTSSDLLRQDNIRTEIHLVDFSDSSW